MKCFKKSVLVTVAMDEEYEEMKEVFKEFIFEKNSLSIHTACDVTINEITFCKGANIIILKTGIGKLAAATSVMYLLLTQKIDVVVNVGFAAAADYDAKINDVFNPFLIISGDYKVPKKLKFKSSFGDRVLESKYKIGSTVLISTDSFVTYRNIDEIKDTVYDRYPHLINYKPCFDMEGFAVAFACLRVNKPCSFYKVISDHPNIEHNVEQFKTTIDGSNHFVNLVDYINNLCQE
jgi:nucleoside phosphorylase